MESNTHNEDPNTSEWSQDTRGSTNQGFLDAYGGRASVTPRYLIIPLLHADLYSSQKGHRSLDATRLELV